MIKQQNKTLTEKLEKTLVKFSDLVSITELESNEPFVLLDQWSDTLFGKYEKLTDMQYEFPKLPVRETVAKKLILAAQELKKLEKSLALQVTYGYRSLEIQRKYFQQQSLSTFGRTQLSDKETEKIHRVIAVPSVAGHPTGGAIDILIIDMVTKKPIDMGSPIYDLGSVNVFFFSPKITLEQRRNRSMLRKIMVN